MLRTFFFLGKGFGLVGFFARSIMNDRNCSTASCASSLGVGATDRVISAVRMFGSLICVARWCPSSIMDFWLSDSSALSGVACRIGTFDFGATYKFTPNIQLDAGVNLGVTESADDANPFVGLTVRY